MVVVLPTDWRAATTVRTPVSVGFRTTEIGSRGDGDGTVGEKEGWRRSV